MGTAVISLVLYLTVAAGSTTSRRLLSQATWPSTEFQSRGMGDPLAEPGTLYSSAEVFGAGGVYNNTARLPCNITCMHMPDYHYVLNYNKTYKCNTLDEMASLIRTGNALEEWNLQGLGTPVTTGTFLEPGKYYLHHNDHKYCARLCTFSVMGNWNVLHPFHDNTYQWIDMEKFSCHESMVLLVDDQRKFVRVFQIN